MQMHNKTETVQLKKSDNDNTKNTHVGYAKTKEVSTEENQLSYIVEFCYCRVLRRIS